LRDWRRRKRRLDELPASVILIVVGLFKRLFGGGDSPAPRDHDREKSLRASRPPLEKPVPAFPFPIEAYSGAMASQRLERLREHGKRDGFTAVLLGDDEDVSSLAELPQLNEQAADTYLEAAAGLDVTDWMKRRREVEFGPDWEGPELGEWPAKADRNDSLLAHVEIRNNRPKPRVYIARFPTTKSWEVFAHLRYGNWNACPDAHEHVAVVRSWHERFGAEVVAITRDTVELEIARTPRDRKQAVEVAWEQYWYCNDIVDQGVESIHRLAANLMVSRYWFFWWD
jgi:hypothetical protein